MFGLFRKKKEEPQQVPISCGLAASQPEPEEKAFCVGLSWKGLFGLLLVFFILQMWMFFLGMWAAQTIVFPTAATALPVQERQVQAEAPVEQMKQVGQAEEQQAPSEPGADQMGAAPAPP